MHIGYEVKQIWVKNCPSQLKTVTSQLYDLFLANDLTIQSSREETIYHMQWPKIFTGNMVGFQ